MATIGALMGAGIFGADKAFGKKPDVPALRFTDPNRVQAETIAANKDQLPQLESIGRQTNQFNLDQQLGMLRQALEMVAPGQLGKAQGVVNSQLAGEVPADVALQLQRRSSAQALAGGYGAGSGIGRNLSARDFGLTSMGIQQQGMQNFGALASLAPKTPLFDMTSMFYTPQQRLEFAFRQNESAWNRDWRESQVNAAPDPFASAMTQAFMQDEAAIMEMVGNVAGIAGGVACWVARAAYGASNPKWRLFRMWLLTDAPAWFRDFYLAHGEAIGRVVSASKLLQSLVRRLMNPFVNLIAQRYAI